MDKKKLILHFDARNTLFVSDFHSRLTTEKALNTYLSGLVWGSISEGRWKLSNKEISKESPDKSLISFYKYTESKVVKCPSDRPLLRDILGRFTQEDGKQFESIFLEYLDMLKWKFDPNPDLTVQGNDKTYYHYILPTFFYTIYILHKYQRDFVIVIRTFGLDIPHILKAIKAFLNGDHPLFPNRFEIKLCEYENTLQMTNEGYEYKYKNRNTENIFTTNKEREILNHWNYSEGVIAVKDDFMYWLENDYNYKASKPLWINSKLKDSDKDFHHIFFDDCIQPQSEESIVHLRKMVESKTDEGKNESEIIKLEEVEGYSNVNLVQSDLLECIKDQNYFLSKISLCELNFLQSKQNRVL